MGSSDVRLDVRGQTGGHVRLFGGAVTFHLFFAVHFSSSRTGDDPPDGTGAAAAIPPLIELAARLAA